MISQRTMPSALLKNSSRWTANATVACQRRPLSFATSVVCRQKIPLQIHNYHHAYKATTTIIFSSARLETTTRWFSSNPAETNRQDADGQKEEDKGPLRNEELVAKLLQDSPQPAEDLQVRLVVDKSVVVDDNGDTPAGGVMSLLDAIKATIALGVDLVAVRLDVPPGSNSEMNPPVLKAQDYDKIRYKKTKASQEAAAKSKSKAVKVFKFRAGIAENDLQRKVQNMIKHLAAGHSCQVTLMARARLVEQSPTCLLGETLEQVVTLVGEERGTLQGTLKRNEDGTHGKVVMIPVSSSPSSKKMKQKKQKSM